MTKYLSAKTLTTVLSLLAATVSFSAQASVTPDRTRLIFNESDKSISVTLRNNDPKLPYLAQSWIEDEKGVKISSPLAVLPPVQRIEAMMNGQVKIQGLPDIHKLLPIGNRCSISTCAKFRRNRTNPTRYKSLFRRVSNFSGDRKLWKKTPRKTRGSIK